jgi:DNA-binding NarL/FixJ family response regulator
LSARLGNGQGAIEVAAALRPDVILMDIRMPTVNGITATRQLAGPGLLGAGADPDHLRGRRVRLRRAQGRGLRLPAQRSRPENLIGAIHTIANGDSLLSPSVTRRVIDRMAREPLVDATICRRLPGAHSP